MEPRAALLNRVSVDSGTDGPAASQGKLGKFGLAVGGHGVVVSESRDRRTSPRSVLPCPASA